LPILATVPPVAYQQGSDVSPYFLGEGFGDVQVNGTFVDGGVYSAAHAYNLVFEGDSLTSIKDPGGYGDNTGLLNYTISYLGL
jgi:hypothetical protein